MPLPHRSSACWSQPNADGVVVGHVGPLVEGKRRELDRRDVCPGDPTGRRRARPRGRIIHPRVSSALLTQSTPACSCPRTALGAPRPGALAQTRRRVHRYSSGATSWCATHCSGAAAVNTEPAAVNTRGVVGGRVGAGAGRSSVDSVDGSPLPSGADTALAGHVRLTCVETWRSSGEAVGETSRTIARHSPGAAAPTARSRAGRGCRQVSMCRIGSGIGARQAAAAVVAAAACEQGTGICATCPHSGPVARERLNSHSPALRGHFQGGEFAGPGRNMHNRR